MSSMRNAVQRRNHKERSQPNERKRWGLLEKHKDYSARARDHNIKKTKLKNLRQKVLEKNPDEFYHGMMSRSGPATQGKNRTGTVNGDRGNAVLSQEAVRLFKTQDMGYVRTMRNQVRKEVEELEQRSVGLGAGAGAGPKGRGKKVVFVDYEDELRRRDEELLNDAGMEFDMDMDDDDDEDGDGDDFGGDIMEDDSEGEEEEAAPKLSIAERNLRKLQQKEAEKVERRLEVARERLKALTQAEQALDLQRSKMAKSLTVGGINKQGVKFKARERKK